MYGNGSATPPLAIDVLLDEIRQWARDRRIAAHTLAKRAGLGQNTTAAMWHADWSPNYRTVRALETYMRENPLAPATGWPKKKRPDTIGETVTD